MKDEFHLAEFLPYLLNQAAEESSLDFAKVYKERFGMHRTDWRVVAHLGEFGEMSASEICERASEHKTRISRAVSRLVEKGFVMRNASQTDRRQENLNLTLRGESVYRELTRLAETHNMKFEEQLGTEKFKALKSALSELARLQQE